MCFPVERLFETVPISVRRYRVLYDLMAYKMAVSA